MSKVYTITNQKGGVGKTTTTLALASVFHDKGHKVLVIDMDPQGNLGFSLGADNVISATSYEVLKGELRAQYAIQHTKTVDIITSNILLSAIELEFTDSGREYLLKQAINNIKSFYDYILIDTPPALGILTINAMTASDFVIIPMCADIFSLQGITQLNETIHRIQEYSNPKLQIAGVLLNKYEGRKLLNKEVKGAADLIFKELEIPMFKTTVRPSISVTEAQSAQKDVVKYCTRKGILQDYYRLAEEIGKVSIHE